MVIIPDDKDWTWVLEKPCGECGFDTSSVNPADVAALLRANAAQWQEVLSAGSDNAARHRPSPDKWSALEYACHVRDVFRKYEERLHLMLDEDDPLFANWDQDATAIESRYGEQDPKVVAAEVVAAAESMARGLDTVDGAQWERPGRRSDGANFTIDTFARYFIHDPLHHMYDVTGRRYTTQ